MTSMILKGLFETLLMTVASSFFSYLIGIPLGVILVVTDNTGNNFDEYPCVLCSVKH